MVAPLVTIAVPSYNQGQFLDEALASIFNQNVPVEVFVLDGGSTDNSVAVINKWAHRLAGWRSHPDHGQAAAINEGVALGKAPLVCWLNSDDFFLPDGLDRLVNALADHPQAPMAYGRTWDQQDGADGQPGARKRSLVFPFNEWLMAQLCIVSQPGTLIRRTCWDAVGGLDGSLHMALDYDLWWRLYRQFGKPWLLDGYVAVNRVHGATKTNTQRRLHYEEAMTVVKTHYGRVPLKWFLAWPYAVWWRSMFAESPHP